MKEEPRAALQDRSAVEAFLAGPDDERGRRAASDLLGRYQGRVYAWCFRYVADHEAALDLTQEILMQAFLKLRSLRDGAQFGAWLYTLTRNRCVSELRRPGLLVDPELEPDQLHAAGQPPDRMLEECQDEERVLALLTRVLTPLEQDAVSLRCFERMPVDAITQVLQIKERSGARAVLQRARRKLRAALADDSDRWGGDHHA